MAAGRIFSATVGLMKILNAQSMFGICSLLRMYIDDKHNCTLMYEIMLIINSNMAAMRNIEVTSNFCYQDRSQGCASVCTVPTRDVATPTRNLQNIKDTHAYQPATRDATPYRNHV